jgi:hypothetical protein
MKETLKRYGLAIFFLLAISGLMVLGTMGVRMLGDKMIEGTDIEMKPRGEHLTR